MMEASWLLGQAPTASDSPPLPLLYNDGEHTYVCVQTPHGPEYIQRRVPTADVPGGCPMRSGSSADALWGGYAGASPSNPLCATSRTTAACDFACSTVLREEDTEATDAFNAGGTIDNAKIDMRGCKRRLPGITSSSSFPNCVSRTSEEEDTCDRTFKHSRSFGYTHVVSSSSA